MTSKPDAAEGLTHVSYDLITRQGCLQFLYGSAQFPIARRVTKPSLSEEFACVSLANIRLYAHLKPKPCPTARKVNRDEKAHTLTDMFS